MMIHNNDDGGDGSDDDAQTQPIEVQVKFILNNCHI